MNKAMNFTLAAAFAVMSLSAQAAAPDGSPSDYGAAAPAGATARVVKLAPSTKWINVTNGETVRFEAQGTSFSWHFDAFPNQTIVDLMRIAPAGFQDDGARLFIAPNPLYLG
ncbi:MAG TPA: CzcE family metal-binding protein [Burkholderiaceae bacterium]|jgi:hypothetical protein|nr:CzcE family metal-binding protein [Burkholderiaceae bacterium]